MSVTGWEEYRRPGPPPGFVRVGAGSDARIEDIESMDAVYVKGGGRPITRHEEFHAAHIALLRTLPADGQVFRDVICLLQERGWSRYGGGGPPPPNGPLDVYEALSVTLNTSTLAAGLAGALRVACDEKHPLYFCDEVAGFDDVVAMLERAAEIADTVCL